MFKKVLYIHLYFQGIVITHKQNDKWVSAQLQVSFYIFKSDLKVKQISKHAPLKYLFLHLAQFSHNSRYLTITLDTAGQIASLAQRLGPRLQVPRDTKYTISGSGSQCPPKRVSTYLALAWRCFHTL